MATEPTEAGNGEHHVYRIGAGSGGDGLEAGKHYLGVEAVAWYLNKKGTWFTDRMASGTLEIKLSNGLEKYQAALGTFELKQGAKTAPVFARPVLPDRNYRGGPIVLTASLAAIKKDTVVGSMLKSAASASLGIVAGMVETATMTGPAKLLVAAGEDLIGGVKKVLSETGEKREPIFDFSGLEFSLQPGGIGGAPLYLLFHRGAELDESKLEIKTQGQVLLPFYDKELLIDGAWLLLRMRRSEQFTGVREWFEKERQLRGRIATLMDEFQSEILPKEDALRQLRPGGPSGSTIYDDFSALRAIVLNDGVLSEREASFRVANLNALFVAARKAVTGNNGELFRTAIDTLSKSLLGGAPDTSAVGKAFTQEALTFMGERYLLQPRELRPKRPAKLDAAALFQGISDVPKLVRSVTKLPRAAKPASGTSKFVVPTREIPALLRNSRKSQIPVMDKVGSRVISKWTKSNDKGGIRNQKSPGQRGR